MRTLAVSVFAAAWLLAGALSGGDSGPLDSATETLKSLQSSDSLWAAAALSLASQVADLLHYVIALALWSHWFRIAPKKIPADEPERLSTDVPRWVTWPVVVLFSLKVALLLGAGASLLVYIAR